MYILAFLWLLRLLFLHYFLTFISRVQNDVRILKKHCRILLYGQLVVVLLLVLVVQQELLDYLFWYVWVELAWKLDYFQPALLIAYELEITNAKKLFHSVLLLATKIFSNAAKQARSFFSVGLEVAMAHGLFYEFNNIWHLICLENPAWHYLQKRQSKSIEKCPPIFKEQIKKMVHLGRRDYIRVQGENPVGSVQLNTKIVVLQMVPELTLVLQK